MATVTLYDGKTGDPVAGDDVVPPTPVVSADNQAGVSFALDPRDGRALVQFVVDPGTRRFVAGLELADGDDLPAVNRAVQERIAASDYSLASAGKAPPHLNVFHYLAAPDPVSPAAETRGHLVATDDPIEIGVPSAASAVSVVAFFLERAPWKVVAVRSADTTVSTDDADVTVVVDREFDGMTFLGREKRWIDAEATSADSPNEADAAAATSTEATPKDPPDGADAAAATKAESTSEAETTPKTKATSEAESTPETKAPSEAETTSEREATPEPEPTPETEITMEAEASSEATSEAETTSTDSPDGADATTAVATDADGRGTSGDERPALRIYDGTTGELEYDSRRTGDVPAEVRDDVKRSHRDGVALFTDPAAGVLQVIVRARGTGVEAQFVAEYDPENPEDDLLASFAEAFAETVADLDVAFSVGVADEAVDLVQLTDATVRRPEAFTDADVASLARTDRPLDFAVPDGTAAFELVAFLRSHLGDDRSIAICESGRTDDLAETDVVVTPDPGCETVEPRGETATVLAEQRLEQRLTDVLTAVEAVVGKVDEITGTIGARQRVFAAALSGESLARRGLTVVPVDDRPIGRRRRQARYLVLYGLLIAGLVAGEHTGQFDPLTALLAETYRFQVGPAAETPLPAFQLTHAADGTAIVGGSLAVIVAGAYWLFGHPLGPLAAARSLAGTIRRQVTGGVGSGTVPSSVRSVADPIQASLDDLETDYERLADSEGTIASQTGDFRTFLEQQLFAQSVVPTVRLVSRRKRWRQLLLGVAVGVVVGSLSGIVVLGVLWFSLQTARDDPVLAVSTLGGVAAIVLLASVLKGLASRYGRGRSTR